MENANRRRFSRIAFHGEARLTLPDGEHAVEVADISLRGALIRPQGEMYATMGSNCALRIRLDEESAIRMSATVVHHEGDHYGLLCREIDLDSITHLRRLVALNLGDEALAEREFALLSLP